MTDDELRRNLCDWIAEGSGLAKRRVIIANRKGGVIVEPYMSVLLSTLRRPVMVAQRNDGADITYLTDARVQSYYDEGAAAQLEGWVETDHAAAASDKLGFRLVGQLAFSDITVPEPSESGLGDDQWADHEQRRRLAVLQIGFARAVDAATEYVESIPIDLFRKHTERDSDGDPDSSLRLRPEVTVVDTSSR
ncbi:MAG: hypothetical protein OXC29_09895 [Rhodococcus sp.]|nr:hypothetical protein [Rhodococcus sp. (in: high G+C Gram-positive bacteria)]